MALITPKFDFDFEVIEKGDYKFRVKETKIEPQGEGKTSGKQYLATCTVVGGSEDGKNHFERFFANTKEDFSLVRLAGFLVKLGALKVTGPIDTAIFATPEFENKWLNGITGREFGIKIGHEAAFDKNGQKMDQPRTRAQKFYSLDEINAILAKKGTAGTAAGALGTPDAPPPAPTTSAWD